MEIYVTLPHNFIGSFYRERSLLCSITLQLINRSLLYYQRWSTCVLTVTVQCAISTDTRVAFRRSWTQETDCGGVAVCSITGIFSCSKRAKLTIATYSHNIRLGYLGIVIVEKRVLQVMYWYKPLCQALV